MRAVVTGASGFLGGRLAQMLVDRGDQVTVLARGGSELGHLAGLPVTVVRGDLGDHDAMRTALRGATHVLHCAACSTDWAPAQRYVDANVDGTRNLLRAANEAGGIERFVHVSTTDVYGYPAVPCAEDGPMVDVGLPYNRTKIAGERAVWEASRSDGLPVTVVRPATIFGPRGKDFTTEMGTLLRQRLMAVVGGGTSRGGFTYVDNTAQLMIEAAQSPAALGEAIHAVDGTDMTWREYLKRFAAELGVRGPWIDLPVPVAMGAARAMEAVYGAGGVRSRPLLTRHAVLLLSRDQEYPMEKARRVLGFVPRVGMDEALRHSAAWLRGEWGGASGKP